MNPPNSDTEPSWDVVVVGGALSGAATAWLLRHRNPRLRVLIIEGSEQFSRRVGESTVEVSSYFLGRVLDLSDHLHEHHLTKQGMRFWFKNDRTSQLEDCSETGPRYSVRLPGFQVDRAILDEEMLTRARASGVEVRRPARVREIKLEEGGGQRISWEDSTGASGEETARWVVDATGVAAHLARKQGWLEPNTEHPIAALWSRWTGVKHWDSRELAERLPAWSARTKTTRFNATNHLTGPGWWAWMIPLKGGDVSIGVVFDQRLVELPSGDSLGERLRSMLLEHPVARELLADATFREGDVHLRRNLAYRTTRVAGDGFVLVGDAAGFIDPFYSPGIDWIGYTTTAAAALVDSCLSGRARAARIARHNELFATSYDRWFRAIYRDKYFYIGDHELMTLAFRLDLGLYYFGVVSQPFRRGAVAFETPSFAGPYTRLPYRFIAFYNRRLAAIARVRLARGTWGRANRGRYYGFRSYELNGALPLRLISAMGRYVGLELTEGWRSWFSVPPIPSRHAAGAPEAPFAKVPTPSP